MSKILIKSALERRKIDKIVSLSIDINEVNIDEQRIYLSINPNWMYVNIEVSEISILRTVKLTKKMEISGRDFRYYIMNETFYHKRHKELNKCIKTLEYIKELLTKNNK